MKPLYTDNQKRAAQRANECLYQAWRICRNAGLVIEEDINALSGELDFIVRGIEEK